MLEIDVRLLTGWLEVQLLLTGTGLSDTIVLPYSVSTAPKWNQRC